MNPHRRVWAGVIIWLVLGVLTLAAGCSNGAPQAPAATPAADGIDEDALTSGPARPIELPKDVKVPTRVSDFPDGVYRTQLSVAELEKAGIFDPGAQGNWTLTVKAGTYQMDCQATKDPILDCGNGGTAQRHTTDYGTLRGNGSTVWFVHDWVRLPKINGCIRKSQGPRGCGPEGTYHMKWKKVPVGIEFSHYVGLGEEVGPAPGWWEPKPWVRIS
jgi:hypothetical protein